MFNGQLVEVPGVEILPPNGEPWNKLVRGQDRWRVMGDGYVPQMGILHKTSADNPERILDTAGPTVAWGYAEYTVRWWQDHVNKETLKPEPYSGTHYVVGFDGRAVNTEDVVRFIGWHAGSRDGDANNRSWGLEQKEHYDGRVFRATLHSTVKITTATCNRLGTQWQCPDKYRGPLDRFDNGGRDLYGVFAHFDVTADRSVLDPGPTIFNMLEAAGFERFDFKARQDIDVWSKRQEWLKTLGYYHGAIDGAPGPKTCRALKFVGFPDGIFARWRECAELPPMPPGWVRP